MFISALSTKRKRRKGWKEGPEVSQQPSPLCFSLSSVPRQPLTSWLRSLLHSFCWVFWFNRRLLSWACTSVSSNSDPNSCFPYFSRAQDPLQCSWPLTEIGGWMSKVRPQVTIFLIQRARDNNENSSQEMYSVASQHLPLWPWVWPFCCPGLNFLHLSKDAVTFESWFQCWRVYKSGILQ